SLQYRERIADQIALSAGTLDFQRVLGTASQALGEGHLLEALELQHYDGPFDNPDAARKENAVLRYAQGDQHDGYSLTGMFYHQLWNNTTDIPLRAIAAGFVSNRFGTLDPSDGGRAQRASLSAQFHKSLGDGQLDANAFFIYNQLHLYNDFTHFLVDPAHGDQEVQFENRRVLGGAASYHLPLPIGAIENELLAGVSTRYDLSHLGRTPTQARVPLPSGDDPPSFSNHDGIYLYSLAGYLQATTHWTTSLRSVLGLREDYQHGTDVDYLTALHETDGYNNGGTAHKALLQPKGSLIYTPSEHLEFYLSAGVSFHSTDLRGVNQDKSVDLGLPNAALLSKQNGEEVGMRVQNGQNFTATLAIYNLWQQSETVLDPDAGVDSAGPPSRRYGAELNVSYQFTPWLELYASITGNHTRFTQPFDDGTGHVGTYISNAPVAAGSLALYLTDLGRWSGGLEYRYLGSYPLSSGPCSNAAAARDFHDAAASCATAPTATGQINGQGFGELNLDAHYALGTGWSASLGIYNLLNTHAPAAEFWYVDRLRSEIETAPDGVADVHEHPLEPIMWRLTIAKRFGD
ncbi:MAG TPA: TonB-dependent receptor, partial [Steroidobacteraceae bacterium]|nr:TonB-dependent receptor [Steroidobacteraceae bacterium]